MIDTKAKIVILTISFVTIYRTHPTSPTFAVKGLQGDTHETST
jgi:hypothetical protein